MPEGRRRCAQERCEDPIGSWCCPSLGLGERVEDFGFQEGWPWLSRRGGREGDSSARGIEIVEEVLDGDFEFFLRLRDRAILTSDMSEARRLHCLVPQKQRRAWEGRVASANLDSFFQRLPEERRTTS